MKIGLLLIIAVLSFFGELSAKDIERDKLMWNMAYKGDHSIVHKLALTREREDINDDMITQFVMAYVYYRMGRLEEIEPIFRSMDAYIANGIISKHK